MSKSIVAVLCGGRGSGKTLSMTVEACLSLIAGENVWSNYPIKVGALDASGKVHMYHSTLIDMPDLIAIQKNDVIRNGKVMLDEWSLFCNARRATAISNIIFNGVVQLIRKRQLSFYITTQNFQTLDKQIRWQCDVTVECFDLAFKYANLKEGMVISQTVTDWSGVFTGRALYDWDDLYARLGNTRTRLLCRGKNFWYCYDHGFEYDVLDVMSTKYQLARHSKIISNPDDNDGFRGKLLQELKESIVLSGATRISSDDMKRSLADLQIDGDLHGRLGHQIKAAGFTYKRGRKENYYEIENKGA